MNNCLRDPRTPGNRADEAEETVAVVYRRLSGQLARAWVLCSTSEAIAPLRPGITPYEGVRVWMAKSDAEDRQSRGETRPDDIARLLGMLIVDLTATGKTIDNYPAAGMRKPSLSDLTVDFVTETQQASKRPPRHRGVSGALRRRSRSSSRSATPGWTRASPGRPLNAYFTAASSTARRAPRPAGPR